MRFTARLALTACFILIGAAQGNAIPQLINYQGILLDNLGDPVTTNTSVEFRIWDDEAGGNELWMETQMVDPDDDGRFNVLLGAVTPIPDAALQAAEAWLGVKIAADPEMTPRTQLVSVAYAYRPGTVDGATGGNITSKVAIGIGHSNAGIDAFVAGQTNDAPGNWSTIGGGQLNVSSGTHSTIAGGRSGTASSANGTVGGGLGNTASGTLGSTVGGGVSNTASFTGATVAGGQSNLATDSSSTVGGGRFNRARGYYSVVAGGGGGALSDSNSASGTQSTIGGGRANSATAIGTTIAGGFANTATATTSTVGGGVGNDATGPWSTIPGGWHNRADGQLSFAVGGAAEALHNGSVVIVADYTPNALNPVQSDTTGHMVLMARRGLTLTNTTGAAPWVSGRYLNTHTGAYLTTGGTWTNASDEAKKENFTEIDRADILERIASLNIRRWNYKDDDPRVQHIGPTAQEFHALFNVGNDDKTISTIDPSGIALAAIQELSARNADLEAMVREQQKQIEELRALIK